MSVLLVLLFVGVPLLELLVILQVGAAIGGWLTAGILIIDSIAGAVLLRLEGRRAWSDFRRALSEGRWPSDEVAQGALIIVGGTLLVTPGFVTDLAGFLLLVAPSRRLVARGVRRRVSASGPPEGAAGPFGPGGAAAASGTAPGSAHDHAADRAANAANADRGRRRGGRGRARPSDRGGGEAVELDVEVVEIRREQGPPHLVDGGTAEPVDPDDRAGDDTDR